MTDSQVTDRSVVVGIDFGTLSGRAVVIRVRDGRQLASAVHTYAHGGIDTTLPSSGERLPKDWALQVPADYIDVLRHAVPEAVRESGVDVADVIGVATDFTACTVLPTTADGTPLNEIEEFVDRPHAYVKLWKHHSAQPQADRINALAHERGEPWIERYGGKLSSEWELAKGLQLFEEDPDIYRRADHWVEAADWIVWRLCGNYLRNTCTAGYKAVLQDDHYPSKDFLAALNEGFTDFFDVKVSRTLAPLGAVAGYLTEEASGWTGLRPGTVVAVGNVDAHVTAPAAQSIDPGQLLLMMGTSTCHVMNADHVAAVPGMCGVVRDGITPGLWGFEAGQSGVGDIFGWFVDNCVPESCAVAARDAGKSLHEWLSDEAAEQAVGAHGLIALDWHSGNRSVLVDHGLSGLVVGLTLQTRPPEIYRALLEATAFGTRVIVEAFEAHGVPVTELVVAGGLIKNKLLMQIYSDVTRRPLSVAGSEQGAALGAAIHAAVAAGAYPDIQAASAAMGAKTVGAFAPDSDRADAYDALYAEYVRLHDYFGRGDNDVMHRLGEIKRVATTR
jgi:L-ribulokinase